MHNNQETKFAIGTFHLQQHELVKFLYNRFMVGMLFTMVVAVVAVWLAAFELELQRRQAWVYSWIAGLGLIQYARYRLKQAYDRVKDEEYMNHRLWKGRFVIGVYLAALWQGLGAMLVMPYISDNLQFIFHVFLLGMGAGAIAYLSTSMMIYGSYLLLMIMPVTLYLFWEATPDGIVLGLMYLFMIGAYFFGVRRMHQMITDALLLRFENEVLVNDLQRLLGVVAKSNKELDTLSTTDELTGASNFRAFRVGLESQRRQHIDSKLPLAIAMINIDYFYEYNLFYGHDMANRTITQIAHLLMAEVIQQNELVARLNGAEFAVLMPGVSCEGARMVMEKVRSKLQRQQVEHARSSVDELVTLSIGICCVPVTESVTSREMIQKSEGALRTAKKKGRNRIEVIDT